MQYHQRIAQVMEAQFADVAEIQPELLAHHYSEAGLAALALPYYQQAGAKAVARSAYREAALFERALGVMQHLPDSPDTIAQAIDLRLALRTALRLLGEFDVPWWCCARPRPSQRRSAMHVDWDRSRSIGRPISMMAHMTVASRRPARLGGGHGRRRRGLACAGAAISRYHLPGPG